MVRFLPVIISTACLLGGASAFAPSAGGVVSRDTSSSQLQAATNPLQERMSAAATALLSFGFGLLATPLVAPFSPANADMGAETAASAKITTGGASTLQSGRVSAFCSAHITM